MIQPRLNKLLLSLGLIFSSTAFAEISLIDQKQIFNDQDQFKLTTSGSIRLQSLNFDHYDESNESQKYRRDGYSSNSRMYANADYAVNDRLHVIAGYQNYINLPKMLDWDGHYKPSDENIHTEQAYIGISDQQYGALKFGKIYSIYYDVVGAKTDLWDYSTLAQPQTWSPIAYTDGTQAAQKTLRYEHKSDKFDIYASYLMKDSTPVADTQLQYERKFGAEFAVDLHLNKNLSWATSWKYNDAGLQGSQIAHDFKQEVLASSLFYFNGQWMFGLGAGWYKNLLPNFDSYADATSLQAQSLLDTEAYGVEFYAGQHFKVEQYGIKFIQPYIMGNHLEYTSGTEFKRRDLGVGVAARFNHGLGFDYERLYTHDTFNTPDMHLFRLRYEW